jgi:hypothetical protein
VQAAFHEGVRLERNTDVPSERRCVGKFVARQIQSTHGDTLQPTVGPREAPVERQGTTDSRIPFQFSTVDPRGPNVRGDLYRWQGRIRKNKLLRRLR